MDNKWHTGCCVVFRVEKWVDKQVYLKPVSKLRLFYHVTCSNLRGQWKRASISASSVRRMSSGNSSQHDICTTASISEHTFMFFLCFSSTDTVRCVCTSCVCSALCAQSPEENDCHYEHVCSECQWDRRLDCIGEADVIHRVALKQFREEN